MWGRGGFGACLGGGFGWGGGLCGLAAGLGDGFALGRGLYGFVAWLGGGFGLRGFGAWLGDGFGCRRIVAGLGQGQGVGALDKIYGDEDRRQGFGVGVRHGFFMAVGMWCCRYARFCINP